MVTRAAIPGLLLAYQHEADLYERLVNRSERDVRALLGGLLSDSPSGLSPKQATARTDAAFDFLVASTVIRAMTLGFTDQDIFCDNTADALTALACSPWHPTKPEAGAPP